MKRFGKDSIIALATVVDNIPYVRNVDAYYEDEAFYVLTHGLSSKMKQIFSAWIDNGHNNSDDVTWTSCHSSFVPYIDYPYGTSLPHP